MELLYEGIWLRMPETVYYPAEDSFMLARAAGLLRGQVLEIGCGCGIASLACARADEGNTVLGTDINPDAVLCSSDNAARNRIGNASFILSDLFSAVPGRAYDAIMFNPPYLPTSREERLTGPLNSAFDGGLFGRAVLDQFMEGFDRYLRPGGTLLLVQSSLNDEKKTRQELRNLGYSFETAASESFFFERLSLVRARKP